LTCPTDQIPDASAPRWAERWLFGIAALLLSLVGGLGDLPGERSRLDPSRPAAASEAAGQDRALAGVERARPGKDLPDRGAGPDPVPLPTAVAAADLPVSGAAVGKGVRLLPQPVRTSPRQPTGPPVRI